MYVWWFYVNVRNMSRAFFLPLYILRIQETNLRRDPKSSCREQSLSLFVSSPPTRYCSRRDSARTSSHWTLPPREKERLCDKVLRCRNLAVLALLAPHRYSLHLRQRERSQSKLKLLQKVRNDGASLQVRVNVNCVCTGLRRSLEGREVHANDYVVPRSPSHDHASRVPAGEARIMEAEPNEHVPQPLSLSIEKESQLNITPEKPVKTRRRRQDEVNRREEVEASAVTRDRVPRDVENWTVEGRNVYAKLSSPGVNSSARLYRKMEDLKTRRALQMGGGLVSPAGTAGLFLNPDPSHKSRALQVQAVYLQ